MDVIIVGAGMVGLALAKALAQQQFHVAVIDAKAPELMWDQTVPALRVSAINTASQQLLVQLGVWTSIALEVGCHAYQAMQVWDQNSSAEIAFNAKTLGATQLGHIVDNRVVIKALWQSLIHESGVQLFAPESIQSYEFNGQHWQVHLTSGQTLKARLLVGADGAQSMVRKRLGIGLSHTFCGQAALVCTVQTEKSHQDTAYQRFLTTGPLAFLPLKNPHQCSIVWSNTTAQAQHLASVSDAVVNAYMSEGLQQKLGAVQVLGERAVFPLNRQQAEQYVKSQAVLVGDAAHTIHPLAGLGANLGFADVAAISKVLGAAKQRARPFYTSAILQRYVYERYGINAATLLAMEGFEYLFSNQHAFKAQLRSFAVNGVDRWSWLKSWCMQQAMGVTV